MLRPATFVMKCYRAEDIPRSIKQISLILSIFYLNKYLIISVDSNVLEVIKSFFSSSENKKELVDPYVTFSFAGKKVAQLKRH